MADVVAAMRKLVDCPTAVGEVINVGSDESITINDLADKVIALTGSRSTTQHVSYEEAYGRPFDDMLIRVPDLTKIKRLIGYEPKYNLEQTLEQIIDYEKSRPASQRKD